MSFEEDDRLASVGRTENCGQAPTTSLTNRTPQHGYKHSVEVPFTLDSSLINTSAGSAHPFRQISKVIPIITDGWNGVSTAGITASWDGENGEVSEDAPVLVQPSIKTWKAQAFVPFSIEVGADWVGMESELRMAFTDTKDTLEATAFATGAGDGSSMPTGIVTALTGTGAVQASAGTDAYAVADVYATINKVAPRHRGQASWVAAYSTINLTRQFGTPSTTRSCRTSPPDLRRCCSDARCTKHPHSTARSTPAPALVGQLGPPDAAPLTGQPVAPDRLLHDAVVDAGLGGDVTDLRFVVDVAPP